MRCLCILINSLLVTSLAKVFFFFFPFCGLFFHFVYTSFAIMQKLLHFIRSHLFIFVFILITLGGGSKKTSLQFMSKNDMSMFSSKNFIVSTFIFRSLIHFEFIIVCDVRECSNFILLHVAVQFSQILLLFANLYWRPFPNWIHTYPSVFFFADIFFREDSCSKHL